MKNKIIKNILFVCIFLFFVILHIFTFNIIEGLESKYNSKDFDTIYHKSAEDIIKDDNTLFSLKNTVVKNENGKMLVLGILPATVKPFYYDMNAYKYGSHNYVPSYEDTVLLSRENVK